MSVKTSIAKKAAKKAAKKKVAAKVAAKGGARLVPGAGQVLMAVEGTPVAVEGLRRTGQAYSAGAKETLGHGKEALAAAKELRFKEAAKSAGKGWVAGAKGSAKGYWEFTKGAGRTALAAVVAKEAAEATYNPVVRVNPDYTLIKHPPGGGRRAGPPVKAPMSFNEYAAWRESPGVSFVGMMAEVPKMKAEHLHELIERNHPMAWMAQYELTYREELHNLLYGPKSIANPKGQTGLEHVPTHELEAWVATYRTAFGPTDMMGKVYYQAAMAELARRQGRHPHPDRHAIENQGQYKQYWVQEAGSDKGMMIHALNAPLAEAYARKKLGRPRAKMQVIPVSLLNPKGRGRHVARDVDYKRPPQRAETDYEWVTVEGTFAPHTIDMPTSPYPYEIPPERAGYARGWGSDAPYRKTDEHRKKHKRRQKKKGRAARGKLNPRQSDVGHFVYQVRVFVPAGFIDSGWHTATFEAVGTSFVEHAEHIREQLEETEVAAVQAPPQRKKGGGAARSVVVPRLEWRSNLWSGTSEAFRKAIVRVDISPTAKKNPRQSDVGHWIGEPDPDHLWAFKFKLVWHPCPKKGVPGFDGYVPCAECERGKDLVPDPGPQRRTKRDVGGMVYKNPPTKKARRNPRQSDVSMYQDILAYLRALQWVYTTTHWTSAGVNSYGDHLLLQRLYEGLDKPIDALGERMVAYFGPRSVAPGAINKTVQKIIDLHRSGLEGLLDIEVSLQAAIRGTWKANQDSGDEFSLGLDDYLMGLANDRDEAIYLLKQRQGQ